MGIWLLCDSVMPVFSASIAQSVPCLFSAFQGKFPSVRHMEMWSREAQHATTLDEEDDAFQSLQFCSSEFFSDYRLVPSA